MKKASLLKKTSPLLVIFFIVFFDLLSFGIVIPILPYYSESFGADAFIWSFVMAIYSIMQFLFSPFWGSLSDRHGRRPILLLSLFCGALSMVALGYANSILWIFICRMAAGIFAANISTATAYIADSTTEENRAKGMGIIGAGFGLGFLFGPVIGGLFVEQGFHIPVFIAAGLGVLNSILGFFILPEPLKDLEKRKANRRRFEWSLVQRTLSASKTAVPVVLFFISTFAFAQLEVSFGYFVMDRFSYSAKEAAYLLALMGFVMVLIQGGAIGRLSKRYGERKLAIVGFLMMAVALIGAGFTASVTLFTINLVFIGIANALINPSLSSIMSKAAPKEQIGGMMGIYQSASSLGRIIGPPIAGYIYVRLGMASPLYLSSTIMAIAGATAIFCLAPSKKADLSTQKN